MPSARGESQTLVDTFPKAYHSVTFYILQFPMIDYLRQRPMILSNTDSIVLIDYGNLETSNVVDSKNMFTELDVI